MLRLKPPNLAVLETPAPSDAPNATESLTRRLAAGSEEAFRQFHRLYFDRLYHFLLAVGRGDEQQARDALQETLLRVARSRRVFQSEQVFWCWLKAVARNVARDAGRKHHRHLELLRRFSLVGRSATVDEREQPLTSMIEECLEVLDPEEQKIIEAKYVNGETVREISADLGTTEKAVESRLLRARQKLRGQILRKLQAS